MVVASEPFDDDPGWVDVPDRRLVRVGADGVDRVRAGAGMLTRPGELDMAEPDPVAHARRGRTRRVSGGPDKTLPSKYFYDAVGSDLFDRITRLPGVLPDPGRALDPGPPRGRDRRDGADRDPGRDRQRHLGEDPTAALCPPRPPARSGGSSRSTSTGGADSATAAIAATSSLRSRSSGLVGDFEQPPGDRLPRYPRPDGRVSRIDDRQSRPCRARAVVCAACGPRWSTDSTFLLGADLVKSVDRLHGRLRRQRRA